MRPARLTTTDASGGVTTSSILPLDYVQAPFAVGFGVVVTGTVSVTVQHTFDNVQDSTVTPTWFDHSSVAAKVANTDGNYAFPVRAIRVKQNSGTGSTVTTVIQSRRGS
jgi:hypothetical protein